MKHFIIVTVSLILCYSVDAQDFRKANWGDSQSAVKASETLIVHTLAGENNSIIHQVDYLSIKQKEYLDQKEQDANE
jgi:hypothetical protein